MEKIQVSPLEYTGQLDPLKNPLSLQLSVRGKNSAVMFPGDISEQNSQFPLQAMPRRCVGEWELLQSSGENESHEPCWRFLPKTCSPSFVKRLK